MASQHRTDSYFRKRFRIERERRGWSQADVANMLNDKKIGIPVTGIAKIESGARTVRIDEAVAIADIFEVSLDSLLGRGAGLEDDLTYALRGLRETARRVYSQLMPLSVELAAARDETTRFQFAGREHLDQWCERAVTQLLDAANTLTMIETTADPSLVVPDDSTVTAGDTSASLTDGPLGVRAVFQSMEANREGNR